MFRKRKIGLAIYDELELEKETLHHIMEHAGYEVYYSTSKVSELIEYFRKQAADILIYNRKHNSATLAYILKRVKKAGQALNVICFYSNGEETRLARMLKRRFDTELYCCSGKWSGLCSVLDALTRDHRTARYDAQHPRLQPSHRFYQIVNNIHYFEILKGLAHGRSSKQLEGKTGLKQNTINSYIKTMHELCACRNTTEMIHEATKAGLI